MSYTGDRPTIKIDYLESKYLKNLSLKKILLRRCAEKIV